MGDEPGKQDRLRLKALLKEKGWAVLRELGGVPGRALRVRCRNAEGEVEIMVRRAGSAAPGSSLRACGIQDFSRDELAILNAIGPEGDLVQKEFERLAGIAVGPVLTTLLNVLEQRGAVVKVPLKQHESEAKNSRYSVRWSDAYRAYRAGAAAGRKTAGASA
jgi:hypothetical protein